VIVEVCTETISSVIAADRGGATGVELCQNLMGGGTTPSLGMVHWTLENTSLRVNALIRPRVGDFCYSAPEKEMMLEDIRMIKDAGAAGVVTGALMASGEIDITFMEKVIDVCGNSMDITFHRAFDASPSDPVIMLNDLIEMGVNRLLTSGRAVSAWEGRKLLSRLVVESEGDFSIAMAAGINSENVLPLMRATGAWEVHFSARKPVTINRNHLNHDGELDFGQHFESCPNEIEAICRQLEQLGVQGERAP